jgi:cob(I)alamin adenosyltransferase
VKVYTRGGDQGDTSLFGGGRVRKDDLRVEAYGAVDEMNAILGIALTEIADEDLRTLLETVQRALFDLGGELATPDVESREARGKSIPRISDADVETLEREIDRLDTELEPLRAFVLPGGARGAALLHHARTVCRRAERRVVRLASGEKIAPVLVRYLNRLSDTLFVVARVVNHRSGIQEPTWEGLKR